MTKSVPNFFLYSSHSLSIILDSMNPSFSQMQNSERLYRLLSRVFTISLFSWPKPCLFPISLPHLQEPQRTILGIIHASRKMKRYTKPSLCNKVTRIVLKPMSSATFFSSLISTHWSKPRIPRRTLYDSSLGSALYPLNAASSSSLSGIGCTFPNSPANRVCMNML